MKNPNDLNEGLSEIERLEGIEKLTDRHWLFSNFMRKEFVEKSTVRLSQTHKGNGNVRICYFKNDEEMEKLGILQVREFIEMILDAGRKIFACKARVDMFHSKNKISERKRII